MMLPRRALGLAGVAFLLAFPVEAQRVSLPGDSAARLTGPLSAPSRAAARDYLDGTDSVARHALAVLVKDPAAFPLLLALLPHEPVTPLRRALVHVIQRGDSLAPRRVAEVLEDRLRNDTDVVVVKVAADGLRSLALRATGLPRILAGRIAGARATRDTVLLRMLLEEEESFAHIADRLVHAPAFMRTPPPIFSAAPAAPRDKPVRIVAFGDYGTAHFPRLGSHQIALATVMRKHHGNHPFTFGLTTGDNFYPTSFASPADTGWAKAWDSLYTPLGIPFYISLGNHDWGLPAGPVAQYIYALTSPSWKLPALYYSYTAGGAQFFAINTNVLTERQLTWLRDELAKSTARWKVVYGHYPIYEQTGYDVERQQELLLPILKRYQVDLYLSGHHHSLQHWQADGIDFVVTGAGGAGTYPLDDTSRTDARQKFAASRPGFADLEISGTALTLRFVGIGAVTLAEAKAMPSRGEPVVLYQYTRRKPPAH